MKTKLLTFFLILFTLQSFSQDKEVQLMINLLDNDKIGDVNVKEGFIESIGQIIDYCKANFKHIPPTQKIGILVVVHKKGKPTYNMYSSPELDVNIKNKTLKDLGTLNVANTLLVDFPFFISINSKNEGQINDFKDFISPYEQQLQEYRKADLSTKVKLNQHYAIEEVLPVLSAYQRIADAKFQGVTNFGNTLTTTDFTKPQDIHALTSQNSDYWRATMEMDIGNQLIPITKIYMLVSQGEFDYAKRFIEIVTPFSDPKSISTRYLEEIDHRLSLFQQELEIEINKGIAEHDEGNYQKAIELYNTILQRYPNSAWALYERFYSENAMKTNEGSITLADRTDWDLAKVEIYKHNPLYHMNVRANTGEEAYLMFRRESVGSLFQNGNETLKAFYEYAEIALDLKIHDFAAQLFWLVATFDKENSQTALHNYLYCLEQLGVTTLKNNFEGDFEDIFKQIEQRKHDEMTNSPIYKAMKN